MNSPKKISLFVAIAIAAVLNSACGGGGDNADDSVTCADGWVSHSKDKQGACSSHGGVK
jgi:hypothetical protein